nr:uroporphyrinogen-III synthase [Texcoconibacillus texcoconensis]
MLESRGAHPIHVPLLTIERPKDEQPIRHVLNQMSVYEWVIITSANAVGPLVDYCYEIQGSLQELKKKKIAVVGSKTEAVLKSYGLEAAYVPLAFTGEDLANGLKSKVSPGERVLFAKGQLASDTVESILHKARVDVDAVDVYETFPNESSRDQLQSLVEDNQLDALTFTSPSTVETFVSFINDELWEEKAKFLPVYTIGPVTGKTAREHGFRYVTMAREYTVRGLVETVERGLIHQQNLKSRKEDRS